MQVSDKPVDFSTGLSTGTLLTLTNSLTAPNANNFKRFLPLFSSVKTVFHFVA